MRTASWRYQQGLSWNERERGSSTLKTRIISVPRTQTGRIFLTVGWCTVAIRRTMASMTALTLLARTGEPAKSARPLPPHLVVGIGVALAHRAQSLCQKVRTIFMGWQSGRRDATGPRISIVIQRHQLRVYGELSGLATDERIVAGKPALGAKIGNE